MPQKLHRFECDGRRYALDPETCFCFECDEISLAVLEHYPEEPVNRILHLLQDRFPRTELEEVIGELEWLRATRSILQTPKQETLARRYEAERGLREITVAAQTGEDEAPGAGEGAASAAGTGWRRWLSRADTAAETVCAGRTNPLPALVAGAGRLLLARSGPQREMQLRVLLEDAEPFRDADFRREWTGVLQELRTLAGWAGKTLTVAVGLRLPAAAGDAAPEVLRGHGYTAWFVLTPEKLAAAGEDVWRSLADGKLGRLDQVSKTFASLDGVFEGRISMIPARAPFDGAVLALEKLGFQGIELDLEPAFVTAPGLDPVEVGRSLKSNADDYAEALLKGRMFRAEPFATLFLQIFHGTPQFRRDPSGANALAVNGRGEVFPGPGFLDCREFCVGRLAVPPDGDALLRRFEDVGALTTSPCLRCWAAGLCGGGSAAVHAARTGDFRTPDPAWCAAWCGWIEGAIAAFSRISGAGVNFTRVFDTVSRKGKPSLLALAKALRQRVGMRPLEEADAPLLVRWENWNHASYFTFTEQGTLLGAQYDREMDALHPSPGFQELLVTGRGGRPMGLVRMGPGMPPGTGWLWLYMRRGEDYGSGALQAALREFTDQALATTGLKRVFAPAAADETGLVACLTAAGYAPAGVLRGALFFRGKYHDVQLFCRESGSDPAPQ